LQNIVHFVGRVADVCRHPPHEQAAERRGRVLHRGLDLHVVRRLREVGAQVVAQQFL